jgi:Tol biopolymer transport system component
MSRAAAICAVVSILAVAVGGATAARSDVAELAYIGKIPELKQPALYLINSDGTNRTLLTPKGGVARHTSFSWSPDGRRIAFAGFIGGKESVQEVFIINADGTGLTRLTHSAVNRKRTTWDWSGDPSWSPDGTMIAFDGARDCDRPWCDIPQIFVIRLDGTGERQLTRSTAPSYFPAWSPNGQNILFERYGGKWSGPGASGNWIDNAHMVLYTIGPDGGRKHKVAEIRNELYHCACVAWSPDGTQFTYEAAGTQGKSDIYVMNADGTDPKRLTSHRARDENPDWSPDGTQIAFYSERTGNAQIYVMNTDGTNQVRITHDPWYDQAVRWRPALK